MSPGNRRGNYSMLSALMIFIMLGFGAISVDLSLVRLAASQAQDVSDAASQAAIVLYRQGRYEGLNDRDARALGDQGARFIAARNEVVGTPAGVSTVVWGEWDAGAAAGNEFQSTAVGNGTTAVQVSLDRSGANGVGLAFGSLFGRDKMSVRGNATSASRNLQAILTIDITGSWDKDEFQHARAAALAFFDILAENHGPEDRFGVVVWFNSYAFEYIPMMRIDDAVNNPALARNLLAKLEVGNYAGVPESGWAAPGTTSKHVACKVYGTAGTGTNPWGASGSYYASLKNKWSSAFTLGSTAGRGCNPSMPRYYLDNEGGTDHHTGLMLVRSMIKSQRYYVPGTGWTTASDPLAYRAVVMLTDGEPIAITAPGTTRSTHVSGTGNTSTAAVPTATSWTWQDTAYPETWHGSYALGSGLREYRRDTAHSLANIKTDTVTLANNLATVDSTNIWVVSFRDNNTFLDSASVGDGWYSYIPTGNVATLVDSFEEIARSLPTAIVK